MTDTCPFYETETLTLQRRTIGRDHRPQTSVIPWCSLPGHSPVDRTEARAIGGGRKLQCGGQFDKCPVQDKLIAELEK